jgi:hypothetical protein
MSKNDFLVGFLAVFSVVLITFLVFSGINNLSVSGAYTATTAFIQYDPEEICRINDCELILSSNVNTPAFLRSGFTTSVNCLCYGQVKTFQLRQPNLGVYNPNYYKN